MRNTPEVMLKGSDTLGVERTYLKTYGIYKTYGGRYAIVTDISGNNEYYEKHPDLSYVDPDFALRKAEKFIKSVYSNFIDWNGAKVCFQFKNMGLLNFERSI